MKTILRNFLYVFRRFKMAMLLNMVGLAVAFAAFVVILIQFDYERNFDRCHPTAGRIFRLDLSASGSFSTILPRAFIEAFIPSSPHIAAGSLINPYIGEVYFTVSDGKGKKGFKEVVQTCHPALAHVFDFPVVEGDIDCMEAPEKVMIPQSLARKLYGKESAIGKSLRAEETIWSKNQEGKAEFTVGAVYRDFPENTQLRNVIYMAMNPSFAVTNFGASNYICYVLLDDPSHAQAVVDNFNTHFDFGKIGRPEEKVKLTALTDIYYLDESPDGRIFRSGNREMSYLLLGIALLIIIVAAINYTNFSTALMPLRIKSINTRKVLGSPEAVLRQSLLIEAVLISFLAWLLSVFIVWMLGVVSGLPFVAADLSVLSNLGVILLAGVVAVLTGLAAGLYPAWYTTSVPPALVLKGSFGLSPSGRRLRTLLIGVQFVVSILLIVSSGFVRLQNEYMRRFSLGFDKDQVAIVELSGDIYQKHHETYASRLKDFSGIEDVAFAAEKVASKDTYNTNEGEYKGKHFQYFLIISSYNFLRVMGIPVEEGRDFLPSDENSDQIACVFNRAAREEMQMQAGDRLDGYARGQMIGFAGDVKFTSLRQGANNICFAVGKLGYTLPFSYIRLKAGADPHAAVEHIRKTLAEIDPSYPFDIEFYDTVFNRLYQQEEDLRSMVLVFSVLAILISLVGVFGLVVFDTQYRRKEISIRKVHGATVGEILRMFNKAYLKIVAICFVIAVPIAWYGVSKWLERFAYKTPLQGWIFLVAFVLVAAVTLVTVSFQSWKAANTNPLNSLKSE